MAGLKIFNEVVGFRVPRKGLGFVFDKFKKGDVNLVFVGKAKMRQLNEKWRGRKGVTDVLSFDYEGGLGSGLGEIYICVAVARENAHLEGVSVTDEVLGLFVHGLLHLAGYTHKNKKELAVMKKKAREILCS